MDETKRRVVLGSRSPRRLDLLASVIERDRILVQAPADSREQGFDDCGERATIEQRLGEVVDAKRQAVADQLDHAQALESFSDVAALVVADTIVVVREGASGLKVLGQPPAERWQDDVRRWMRRYLSGQVHEVWTRYSATVGSSCQSQTVVTEVELEPLTDRMIDWYLATGESRGKAGGYAIQGHASAFIRRFQGSITNVIGLPVFELAATLDELGVPGMWHHGSEIDP